MFDKIMNSINNVLVYIFGSIDGLDIYDYFMSFDVEGFVSNGLTFVVMMFVVNYVMLPAVKDIIK